MASQHPAPPDHAGGPKSALGGTLTSPRAWSQLRSGSGPKLRLLHAAKASSSPSLVPFLRALHPAGAGRNTTVPSRWERPFLSTKPHSLVPGWVSAESLSGEQRAPQSHCWVWPAAALQDPGMAPGLSSRWSPERTLPAGAATTGVLLPWDGVVQASQVARTPLVPTPVLCRPPISVALGWGSLRGVEPHALRGGTFAASVSVASQPPPAEGLPLSTSPPSYQSAWLPLCSLVHCFRSARL